MDGDQKGPCQVMSCYLVPVVPATSTSHLIMSCYAVVVLQQPGQVNRGNTDGGLAQCLRPEADAGPPPRPRRPLHRCAAGQTSMADHPRRRRVRRLGHAVRKQNHVMVKQLLFAHIQSHPRPMGRPHLMWMDTAMHDLGGLGHTLNTDLPRGWASLA